MVRVKQIHLRYFQCNVSLMCGPSVIAEPLLFCATEWQ